MDLHTKWSKVLLQWLEACGFVDRKCITLEQTDIHYIFKIFRSSHTTMPQTESETSLYIFLKEHYPEFIPQAAEDGLLCKSEYVLVYSIFMHFSCVRYPETVFHNTFLQLPWRMQRCVGLFLEEALCCPVLDRETLHQVIIAVVKKSETPDSAEEPHCSASNSFAGADEELDEFAKEYCNLQDDRNQLGLTQDKHSGLLNIGVNENTADSQQSEITTKCEHESDASTHPESSDSNNSREDLEISVSDISLVKIKKKSVTAMQDIETKAEEFVNETNKLSEEASETNELTLSHSEHKFENSNKLRNIKTAYHNQATALMQAKQKLSVFEKLNYHQSKTTEALHEILKETINERDRLADDVKSHLRLAREDNSSRMSKTRKMDSNCSVLQTQMKTSNTLCAKMQIQVSDKDPTLKRIQAEKKQDRNKWQKDMSDMGRLLVEQSVRQETYDTALINATAILENNVNLSAEVEMNKFELKISENERNTNLRNFKSAWNSFFKNITQLHTNHNPNDGTMKPVGEIQVQCSKCGQENPQLHEDLELNMVQIEIPQRELALAKKEVQNTATKMSKLENKLLSNEKSSTELNHPSSVSDNDNVQLNSEEDAPNSEIHETKDIHSAKQTDEAKKELHQEQYLNTRCSSLEEVNVLPTEKETSIKSPEMKAACKLVELEEKRQSSEENIRKLNYSLQAAERINLRLLNEVGTIKLQLRELKSKNKENLDNLTKQRDDALARFELLTEELQTNIDNLRDKNTILCNELSEAREILQERSNSHSAKLCDLESTLSELNQQQLSENEKNLAHMETQIEVSQEIGMQRAEQQSLCEGTDAQNIVIENLRRRLFVATKIAQSGRDAIAQLSMDNKILQEKFEESEQLLLYAIEVSEDHFKEMENDAMKTLDDVTHQINGLRINVETFRKTVAMLAILLIVLLAILTHVLNNAIVGNGMQPAIRRRPSNL